MTNTYPVTPPADESLPGAPNPTGMGEESMDSSGSTASEQAKNVGHEAAQSTERVAGTAAEEAKGVAWEVKNQARSLWHEASNDVRQQADTQQHRVASGLRTLSDDLRGMSQNSSGEGMASRVVSQVSEKANSVASWLEERDAGEVMDEVRSFARRRSGAFIAIAAVAGLAVGRLTRSIASGSGTRDMAGRHEARTGMGQPVESMGTQPAMRTAGSPGTTSEFGEVMP